MTSKPFGRTRWETLPFIDFMEVGSGMAKSEPYTDSRYTAINDASGQLV